MDITKPEVFEILGTNELKRTNGKGKFAIVPEWPISERRQQLLCEYVKRHERDQQFRNLDGNPVIMVNKPLVNLQAGAGFGELALMSDIKRMATVRTATPSCILVTLTRRDFGAVMRRA